MSLFNVFTVFNHRMRVCALVTLAVPTFLIACSSRPDDVEPKAKTEQKQIMEAVDKYLCDQLKAYEDNEVLICVKGPNPGCTLTPEGQLASALRLYYCDTKSDLACGSGDMKQFCEQAPDVSCCGGHCTSKHSDPFNCGECGTVCDLGAVCAGGTCACPGDIWNEKNGKNCAFETSESSPPDPEQPASSPPPQVSCADIAAANGWSDYSQNESCIGSANQQYDDFGNVCCPPPPPEYCVDCPQPG